MLSDRTVRMIMVALVVLVVLGLIFGSIRFAL
jgi:hypothetical protein